MNTQTSKTLEEKINTAGKWFSESTIEMAEIYNKQFKLGYDIFHNYFNKGLNNGNGKSTPGFNPDMFHSGLELMRNNIENISRLSEKTMSIFMGSSTGKASALDEEKKITEAIRNAFDMQSKQVAGINQQFFKTYSESFKTTNGDIEKSYDTFRKTTEDNFHMAEEEINRAIQTYSSIINKSAKDREEMFANIAKQTEFLIQSSLKVWSGLLQTADKENNKSGSQPKNKRKANVNQSKK